MLKRIGAISLAALLVVILSGVPFVGAEPATVTCNINSVHTLTLSPGSVGFGNVDPEIPAEVLSAITATVKTNATDSWSLAAKGSDNFVTASYTMPIGRLEHKGGNVGAYQPMTNSDVTVKTGTRGVTETIFDYKLTAQYADPAASGYQATITYTLSSL